MKDTSFADWIIIKGFCLGMRSSDVFHARAGPALVRIHPMKLHQITRRVAGTCRFCPSDLFNLKHKLLHFRDQQVSTDDKHKATLIASYSTISAQLSALWPPRPTDSWNRYATALKTWPWLWAGALFCPQKTAGLS